MTPAAQTATWTPSGPRVTVDLDAIAANTRILGTHSRGDLMAVVKADAFGHGAVDVARTALSNGATWLGVTSITEALELREAGLVAPLLSWLNPVSADFGAAVKRRIDLAVPSRLHLEAVASASTAAGRTAAVHLHLDVGMARDGAGPEEWSELCAWASRYESRGQIEVVGIMGHLSGADRAGDETSVRGLTRFHEGVASARSAGLRPRTRHLAATAALLHEPKTHLDLCRVGAGLFGIDPSTTAGLRPAMTMTAPVVTVRDVPAGTPVGYGHTWIAPVSTRLALLPVGYADGLPRVTSGVAEVMVHGRRRPVVGAISMDQVVIDVGDLRVCPGDQVVVFGTGDDGGPTAADWATWAGTIEHEIVTGIGGRVERVTAPARASRLRGVR